MSDPKPSAQSESSLTLVEESPRPSKWATAGLFSLPVLVGTFFADHILSTKRHNGFESRATEALAQIVDESATSKNKVEAVKEATSYLEKANRRELWVLSLGGVTAVGSYIYGWIKGKKAEESWDKDQAHWERILTAPGPDGAPMTEYIARKHTAQESKLPAPAEATSIITESHAVGRVQEASSQSMTIT